MSSQETTINMVDTTFETLKKEVEVLKSQQEEVEKVAELLSKHLNELEAINNEVITMLMKNRQESEGMNETSR